MFRQSSRSGASSLRRFDSMRKRGDSPRRVVWKVCRADCSSSGMVPSHSSSSASMIVFNELEELITFIRGSETRGGYVRDDVEIDDDSPGWTLFVKSLWQKCKLKVYRNEHGGKSVIETSKTHFSARNSDGQRLSPSQFILKRNIDVWTCLPWFRLAWKGRCFVCRILGIIPKYPPSRRILIPFRRLSRSLSSSRNQFSISLDLVRASCGVWGSWTVFLVRISWGGQ